jgi:hypothetical protein
LSSQSSRFVLRNQIFERPGGPPRRSRYIRHNLKFTFCRLHHGKRFGARTKADKRNQIASVEAVERAVKAGTLKLQGAARASAGSGGRIESDLASDKAIRQRAWTKRRGGLAAADVRFCAHRGLTADIAPCPFRANNLRLHCSIF